MMFKRSRDSNQLKKIYICQFYSVRKVYTQLRQQLKLNKLDEVSVPREWLLKIQLDHLKLISFGWSADVEGGGGQTRNRTRKNRNEKFYNPDYDVRSAAPICCTYFTQTIRNGFNFTCVQNSWPAQPHLQQYKHIAFHIKQIKPDIYRFHIYMFHSQIKTSVSHLIVVYAKIVQIITFLQNKLRRKSKLNALVFARTLQALYTTSILYFIYVYLRFYLNFS